MEQHTIPCLSEIAKPGTAVHPDAPVKEVIAIFQHNQSLPALPIIAEGKFLGIINRKTLFFHHLSRPFAMDLYGKKPIRVLMEANPFAMEPERDINSSLARLLTVDPTLAIDSFPVVAEEECLGIVTVSDLMMKISENQARLVEALRSLSARIRDEVDKASKIQQDLLPSAEFQSGDINLSAGLITSSEIGGDFYDYFTLGNGRTGLVIADVSGHGVQAGMVTTAAKASLHTLINQGVTTPAELLYGMNNAIIATARQALLMTCQIVVIDQNSAEFTLANAGHNFPYVYRRETGMLNMVKEVAGYPLGFEENCTYQELTIPFEAGSTLVLYTDGIVECRNVEGEEFGYGRLEAALREQLCHQPRTAKKLLLERAAQFNGAQSFEDDVTLIIATFDRQK